MSGETVKPLTWLYNLSDTPGVPTGARALASILVRYGETIYVSQDTLAQRMDCSISTVYRHLCWLAEHDWLDMIKVGSDFGRAAKASTYKLRIPEHEKIVIVKNTGH